MFIETNGQLYWEIFVFTGLTGSSLFVTPLRDKPAFESIETQTVIGLAHVW